MKYMSYLPIKGIYANVQTDGTTNVVKGLIDVNFTRDYTKD